MSKARDLADIVAAGSPLVDGTIETTDITNVTASATELNYTDGVTSNIQTQMDTKAPLASPTFTGTAVIPTASVTTLNLGGTAITATATELNLLDGVTATTAELNYVDGVTSAIQTQLDAKGTVSSLSDLSVTATATELNYNDITTLGTSQASKVVTADANGNIKLSEELQTTCYLETAVSVPSTTIDCDEGNLFYKTISSSTTFTFDYSGVNLTTNDAYGFVFILTSSGTNTITWPSTVDWAGGTAPDAPASGETDVYVFTTYNGGSTWYGALAIDAAA